MNFDGQEFANYHVTISIQKDFLEVTHLKEYWTRDYTIHFKEEGSHEIQGKEAWLNILKPTSQMKVTLTFNQYQNLCFAMKSLDEYYERKSKQDTPEILKEFQTLSCEEKCQELTRLKELEEIESTRLKRKIEKVPSIYSDYGEWMIVSYNDKETYYKVEKYFGKDAVLHVYHSTKPIDVTHPLCNQISQYQENYSYKDYKSIDIIELVSANNHIWSTENILTDTQTKYVNPDHLERLRILDELISKLNPKVEHFNNDP